MIPSRGLRPTQFISSIPRQSLQSRFNGLRKFSSAPQQEPGPFLRHRTQHIHPLLQTPRWRNGNIIVPTLLATASAIRFKSTAPAPPASTADSAPSLAPEPTPDVSSLSGDDVTQRGIEDIANIPERIGYLKEIGLDYGWGPTSTVQWLLEHVHIYSGLPWSLSIVATTLLVRVGVFYFYIRQADTAARTAALSPIVKPLNDKMLEKMRAGDQQGAMTYRKQITQVYKEADIRPFKAAIGPLMQAMLGFGAFRLLRGMADLPVPGLQNEGFLWLTDLTKSDPYLLLPAIVGGLIHLTARLGGESGSNQLSPTQQKLFMYGIPGFTFIIALWMPSALQLLFTVTTLLGLSQALLFRRPAVRSFLGIAPIVKPTAKTPKTIETKLKLAPSYQAPTIQSTLRGDAVAPAEPEVKLGLFGRARQGVSGMMEGAKEGIAKMLGRADIAKSVEKKRRERFQKQAEAYERRRREQLEDDLWAKRR